MQYDVLKIQKKAIKLFDSIPFIHYDCVTLNSLFISYHIKSLSKGISATLSISKHSGVHVFNNNNGLTYLLGNKLPNKDNFVSLLI